MMPYCSLLPDHIRLQEHGLLMFVVCVDGFRQIFDISATSQTQHHRSFLLL